MYRSLFAFLDREFGWGECFVSLLYASPIFLLSLHRLKLGTAFAAWLGIALVILIARSYYGLINSLWFWLSVCIALGLQISFIARFPTGMFADIVFLPLLALDYVLVSFCFRTAEKASRSNPAK